jgi:hypothetical protein
MVLSYKGGFGYQQMTTITTFLLTLFQGKQSGCPGLQGGSLGSGFHKGISPSRVKGGSKSGPVYWPVIFPPVIFWAIAVGVTETPVIVSTIITMKSLENWLILIPKKIRKGLI